jgi:hypothetical protein
MVRTRQHSRRGGLAQDTTLKKIQDHPFIESSFQQDFPRLLADRDAGRSMAAGVTESLTAGAPTLTVPAVGCS